MTIADYLQLVSRSCSTSAADYQRLIEMYRYLETRQFQRMLKQKYMRD